MVDAKTRVVIIEPKLSFCSDNVLVCFAFNCFILFKKWARFCSRTVVNDQRLILNCYILYNNVTFVCIFIGCCR